VAALTQVIIGEAAMSDSDIRDPHAPARRAEIAALFTAAAAALQGGLSRPALTGVLESLQKLAAKQPLWGPVPFTHPAGDDRSVLYNVAEGPQGFALYLDIAGPGKTVPPHNHLTWACIAAIEGREENIFYARDDDGATPGIARLTRTGGAMVTPGHGIALMPQDIHAIANPDRTFGRHLHLYGRPLETLTERLQFNPDAGTCRVMPLAITARLA
jgi:predicted metal-dependent enzyme (double-stranded beta helix superfamily)